MEDGNQLRRFVSHGRRGVYDTTATISFEVILATDWSLAESKDLPIGNGQFLPLGP